MTNPLRAAFIGAGPRSRNAHYPNVARLDDVTMESVCELDEERLDMVVEQYGFPSVYTHHKEMLESANPDVVYCVMNEQWALGPVLDCIRAGKHVFIEKPPGANVDEVRQIRDAAVAHNVWVQVGFQRRHAAVVRESMARAQEGGPVSMAVGTFHKQLLGEARRRVHDHPLERHLPHRGHGPLHGRRRAGRGPCPPVQVRQPPLERLRGADPVRQRCHGHHRGHRRASGGRTLGGQLHAANVGCYFNIPSRLALFTNDEQRDNLNGWDLAGVERSDSASYDGTLDMHRHFIDCIRSNTQPLTDIRDTVHTMELVAAIEGEE